LNAMLIAKGYYSIADIARTPADQFIQTIGAGVDAQETAGIYANAWAKNAVLNNISTIDRIDAARGGVSSLGDKTPPPPDSCQCKDCDAAVSPRAYLADLLDFASNSRIREPGATGGTVSLSLDDLVALCYQPLSALPASCAAVDESVRQARLCVEVLRRYL